MKKAFKTIFIYIGVLLLALLATVIFCAGFLFFYREGNIFGIQYIKKDEIIQAADNEDMSDIQKIEVIGDVFDVRVRINPNVDTLKGAMQNRVFGYAKKSKAQASFSMEYDEVLKTAVFKSVEPKGWLSKKNCFIEIAIPTDWAEKEIDLVVKTKKGDIKIGNDKLLLLGDITAESSKGDVSVANISINGNIDLKIGSGTAVIDDNCSSSGVDAIVSVGSGKIDFSKLNTDNFILDVVEVESIKRGKIWIKKANEIITNENIGGGGKIEIAEIGSVDFTSLDTDISINKIIGGGSSRINITGQGDVWVNTVLGDLNIDGYNGDVYVNTVSGFSSLSTNQGDIKMEGALKLVSADSVYGNIEILFSSQALDYTNINPENRAVVATTKNGHIIVKGLQNGHINATGNGRITLEYNRIVGDNKISAQSGAINIVVPNSTDTTPANKYAFNLKLYSEVNTDIKVGVVGSLGQVDFSESGDKTFNNIYNSASSTSNNLDVSSTTGIIKIRSADLIGY